MYSTNFLVIDDRDLSAMNEAEFPALIRELYEVVRRLETMFPGRHFTPDGHLVGSIGEALASHYYDVQLSPASTQGYDGMRNGKRVEVKATQGAAVSLSSGPEHLLVFRLLPNGGFEEYYNGPGDPVWALLAKRKPTKNGQQQVRLSVLRALMAQTKASDVLGPVRPLPIGTVRSQAVATAADGLETAGGQPSLGQHTSDSGHKKAANHIRDSRLLRKDT